MTIFKLIADLIMLVAPVCLFCLWYVKRKTKKDTPSFCNYDLFEYFAHTYNLVLLNDEIEDIKAAVYKNISDDICTFSDDELDDIFHGVIKEMNCRTERIASNQAAEKQNVDVGFWNNQGEYEEDIQKINDSDEWSENE